MNSEEVQDALRYYIDFYLNDQSSPSAKELQDTNKVGRFQAGKIGDDRGGQLANTVFFKE